MTSRSERIEELKRYAEEVIKLLGDTSDLSEVFVERPPAPFVEGEVALRCLFKKRSELWRMTLCECCDPPQHEGWHLASSGAVS